MTPKKPRAGKTATDTANPASAHYVIWGTKAKPKQTKPAAAKRALKQAVIARHPASVVTTAPRYEPKCLGCGVDRYVYGRTTGLHCKSCQDKR